MSEINYYTPDSGVTVQSTQAVPTGVAAWRPGRAGGVERVAAGDGTGQGWFLYFVDRYLVLELWRGGDWLATRTLDCTELLAVPGGTLYHLPALGYALDEDTISLGCVSMDAFGITAASVHEDFVIPGIGRIFTHPPAVHLGAMPVTMSGGLTQHRSLGANLRGVAGRFGGRDYLSRGELSRLAGVLSAELARA